DWDVGVADGLEVTAGAREQAAVVVDPTLRHGGQVEQGAVVEAPDGAGQLVADRDRPATGCRPVPADAGRHGDAVGSEHPGPGRDTDVERAFRVVTEVVGESYRESPVRRDRGDPLQVMEAGCAPSHDDLGLGDAPPRLQRQDGQYHEEHGGRNASDRAHAMSTATIVPSRSAKTVARRPRA